MKNEIIKPVIRVGNSGGVLVPKDWINGSARIELIARPPNIKKDIWKILSPYLENAIGVYLTGSYARGEQTGKSDVDVLVITNKVSKRIKKEKYDIFLITRDDLRNTIENNALPLVPMLIEAKAILNKSYLNSLDLEISKKNLQWNLDMIKSSMNINKKIIELNKENMEYVSDSVAYSLVLNFRSLYIIDCIRKRQKYNTKKFISAIREISGDLKAYSGYLRVKNNEKPKEVLPVLEAEKLLNYILKKLREQEK